jgi:hypothetical protein
MNLEESEELVVEQWGLENYFSSKGYLNKLKFFHYESNSYIHGIGNEEENICPPFIMSDSDGFKEEIKKLIIILQKHIQTQSYDKLLLKRETMRLSIFYLLGYIEDNLFPGIIDPL